MSAARIARALLLSNYGYPSPPLVFWNHGVSARLPPKIFEEEGLIRKIFRNKDLGILPASNRSRFGKSHGPAAIQVVKERAF
jgi:hypothetical protein